MVYGRTHRVEPLWESGASTMLGKTTTALMNRKTSERIYVGRSKCHSKMSLDELWMTESINC
jgi:hypothetical protein